MKLPFHNIFLAFLIICFFASCEERRSNFLDDEVSIDEAAALVEETLSSESFGYVIQADDAAGLDNDSGSRAYNECGVLIRRDITRSSLPGASITFSHTIDFDFTRICPDSSPDYYAISFMGTGSYSSPRLDSEDTITYQAVLENITEVEMPLLYAGEFTRQGTQTTRIAGNTKNFESLLTINSSNIEIDRTTRRILSGGATFSLQGTLNTGEEFSYQGSIDFLGDGQAIIVIDERSFPIGI